MSQIASLEIDRDEEFPVARLSGQIDMSNAGSLTLAILGSVTNRSFGLVADLTEVSYMDSAGINMLADVAQRLRWHRQRLVVVAENGSRVRQVIALAGADQLLEIVTDRAAALARLAETDPVG